MMILIIIYLSATGHFIFGAYTWYSVPYVIFLSVLAIYYHKITEKLAKELLELVSTIQAFANTSTNASTNASTNISTNASIHSSNNSPIN